MARVTVEDCINKVPNQFELVILSAQLAKDVNLGAHSALRESARGKKFAEKASVIALRRIASGDDVPEQLIKNIITGFLQEPNANIFASSLADLSESDKSKGVVRIKTGLSSSSDIEASSIFEDMEVVKEADPFDGEFKINLENSADSDETVSKSVSSSIKGKEESSEIIKEDGPTSGAEDSSSTE